MLDEPLASFIFVGSSAVAVHTNALVAVCCTWCRCTQMLGAGALGCLMQVYSDGEAARCRCTQMPGCLMQVFSDAW